MKWEQEFKDANEYAKAAKGFWVNRKVDNETMYNIVALSVEQYAAALASHIGFIPVHSGLTSVFRELNSKIQLPKHFIDSIRFLNRFMTYCSLEISKPLEISDDEILQMIDFMDEFGDFVKLRLT